MATKRTQHFEIVAIDSFSGEIASIDYSGTLIAAKKMATRKFEWSGDRTMIRTKSSGSLVAYRLVGFPGWNRPDAYFC